MVEFLRFEELDLTFVSDPTSTILFGGAYLASLSTDTLGNATLIGAGIKGCERNLNSGFDEWTVAIFSEDLLLECFKLIFM